VRSVGVSSLLRGGEKGSPMLNSRRVIPKKLELQIGEGERGETRIEHPERRRWGGGYSGSEGAMISILRGLYKVWRKAANEGKWKRLKNGEVGGDGFMELWI